MSSGVVNLDAYLRKGFGHIHLVGICGVGMAGLALLLKKRGFKVSGCDLALNDLVARLEASGIAVSEGNDAEHIGPDVNMVVRTSAVPADAPEIAAAAGTGIPVFRRGEVLAAVSSMWKTLVAVSGTHGKTTTASFLMQIFKTAGRDPSWCIGGDTPGAGQLGVAGAGDGDVIITESDESDGTVALYSPAVGVITNIEYDHMENFDGPEAFKKCFVDFVKRVTGAIVYSADDPGSAWLAGDRKAFSFGLGTKADFRINILEESGTSSSFEIINKGEVLCTVRLPVPGRHNVLNAAAAITAALQAGVCAGDSAAALGKARLPRRRFERVAENAGIRVISDYAHHPSEIRALVRTAVGQGCARVLAVFQPHRYSRTRALCKDFPPAFEGVDELLLCPVYAASEEPLEGGTIYDLYRCFREMPVKNVPLPALADNLRQAWEYLKRRLRPGDLLIVVGAGDVEKIAKWATEEIRQLPVAEADVSEIPVSSASQIRLNEPMAGKTTLGVGGSADVWVDVCSEEDLVSLLAWSSERRLPFRCIGCGSNVLASDLGLRGVTVRLRGESFAGIKEEGRDSGRVMVRAGGGVKVAELLSWSAERGLSGLEFLEGIPATLGGVLRMNAGAWGDEVKNHISSIRCLNRDGSVCILKTGELKWGYRWCASLEGLFVVEAQLFFRESGVESIVARRKEIVDKRAWMRGVRSAGSIFRNPGNESAGRLIDGAGLKGLSIGGARVFEKHANVIVAGPGATASDVKALLEIVRGRIAAGIGVKLECEIVEMI